MDITIRTIQQRDLPALLCLYAHLHPTDAPLPDEPHLERVWGELLSDPKLYCFVAELNSELIASCTLVVVPNLTRGARPYGLLENVVTHAAYRRQGVGTRLMRYALQIAWQQDCYKVMLLSGAQREEAHQFYERAGFKKGKKTGFVATPEDQMA